jgi:hypothetical protein
MKCCIILNPKFCLCLMHMLEVVMFTFFYIFKFESKIENKRKRERRPQPTPLGLSTQSAPLVSLIPLLSTARSAMASPTSRIPCG